MIRQYDPETDGRRLWELKRRFELELGANTGGTGKETKYRDKLTEEYRDRYLRWAADCIDEDDGAIHVAERDGDLVGYAFVLPEPLVMIWDAAVLNELFVTERVRGTDVADMLMDAVFTTASAQDLPMDRLVLDVDGGNDRAQAFYERYGFERWGEMVAAPLK